jgi:hypothetical protein
LGANGTYHVSLSSKPSNADVIIAIAADSSQLQVSPTTLIFTSGNWSAAQTVTVVALADSVPEGNHTVFIHHAIHSIDRAFSNLPVVRAPVSIFDYELQLNTTSLIVTEASSTAFTVNVGCGSFSCPRTNMSVFVAIEQLAGLPSVSVVPANLSIASFSSATSHLIHIDGPAEDLVDFGHSVRRVSLTIASTDMSYTATKHLPITVLSNDLAGVTVNSTSMMVTEGGASSYSIRLTTQPVATVNLSLVPTGSQIIASPSHLRFENCTNCSSSWQTPQVFTLRGLDDDRNDGNRTEYLSVNASSLDPLYGSIARIPRLNTSEQWCRGGECSEYLQPAQICAEARGLVQQTVPAGKSAGDVLSVQLDDGSTLTVTVPVGVDAGGQFLARTGPLQEETFMQLCEARRACSRFLYGRRCDGRMRHADGLAELAILVQDDDVSGIIVTTSQGEIRLPRSVSNSSRVATLHASEDGMADVLTIRLRSQPRGTVKVGLLNGESSDQLRFFQGAGSVLLRQLFLNFNQSNWNHGQVANVRGTDDLVAENSVQVAPLFVISTVNNTAVDMDYNRSMEHVANVSIVDNDVAMVSIHAPFEGQGIVEGAQSTYKIWLETRPTAQVSVDITCAQVEVKIGNDLKTSAQVIFTPTDWNIAQQVTIQAADDFDIERRHSVVDAGGENYFVGSNRLHYNEGDVSNIRSHVGVLHHQVSSGDVFYDSAYRAGTCGQSTSIPVYVRVIDNDEPRVFLTETAIEVTEGGDSTLFMVKLLARPTKDVHFDLLFDPQSITVRRQYTSLTSLVFRAATWTSTTQEVVQVTAVDDARDEDLKTTTTIALRIRSEDIHYGNASNLEIVPAPIVVTVTDNDYSAVLLDRADNKIVVRENGMNNYYHVRLATKPYAPVVVHISPGDVAAAVAAKHQVHTLNSSVLNFTEHNWNQPQTVTVAAVDDAVPEEACSAPIDQFSTVKLDQVLSHQMVTMDTRYLSGCGPASPTCAQGALAFALLIECTAACGGSLAAWCGGCLYTHYQPGNCTNSSIITGTPSVSVDGCWVYEARQGMFYEGSSYPDPVSNADEFAALSSRTGNFQSRWTTKKVHVVDDDSSTLTQTERLSDVSERKSFADWSYIGNASLYAGVPSPIVISAKDLCDELVPSWSLTTFHVVARDGFAPLQVANISNAPYYTADVTVGPVSYTSVSIRMLVNSLQIDILGSPIHVQVLPGPVSASTSYVMGLAQITTAGPGSADIYWKDEFGRPTALVCRPQKRHKQPVGQGPPPWSRLPSSDCRDGRNEHATVFSVEFLNASSRNPVHQSVFSTTMTALCTPAFTEPVKAPSCAVGTRLTYSSTVPGNYLIHISLDNMPLAGSPPGVTSLPSPYALVVAPGPTVISKCYAEGVGASIAQAGQSTQFSIKLADVYGNVKSPLESNPVPFQCLVGSMRAPIVNGPAGSGAYVHAQASSIIEVGTVSAQRSGYVCTYLITVAGPYHISVGIGGGGSGIGGLGTGGSFFVNPEEIMGSPMTLHVSPAEADPNYYGFQGIDTTSSKTTTAGVQIVFGVLARDKFLNPSTLDNCVGLMCGNSTAPLVSRITLVDTTVITGVTEHRAQATVSVPLNGVYTVNFTPRLSGICRVHVSVDTFVVPNSPIELMIIPATLDPSMTSVDGSGTQGAVAGHIASFAVNLKDSYGNRVQPNTTDARFNVQVAVLRAVTHCFNVTNVTHIPSPAALGVYDLSCVAYSTAQSRGSAVTLPAIDAPHTKGAITSGRIQTPRGCAQSWTNNTVACSIPIDCQGSWGAWSGCSQCAYGDASCSSAGQCGCGNKTRVFSIFRAAENGGYPCATQAGTVQRQTCSLGSCWHCDGGTGQFTQSSCEQTGNSWGAGVCTDISGATVLSQNQSHCTLTGFQWREQVYDCWAHLRTNATNATNATNVTVATVSVNATLPLCAYSGQLNCIRPYRQEWCHYCYEVTSSTPVVSQTPSVCTDSSLRPVPAANEAACEKTGNRWVPQSSTCAYPTELHDVGIATASNHHQNQVVQLLFDGDLNTYWDSCCQILSGLTLHSSIVLQLNLTTGTNATGLVNARRPITGYKFATLDGECPAAWTLESSNDTVSWQIIDTQAEQLCTPQVVAACSALCADQSCRDTCQARQYVEYHLSFTDGRYFRWNFTELQPGAVPQNAVNGYRLAEIKLLYDKPMAAATEADCLYTGNTWLPGGTTVPGRLEYQYLVANAGAWEVIIVLTVDGVERFFFSSVAGIIAPSAAAANATMSTIEGLKIARVNETSTFYLQARTARGINLVSGGDNFRVTIAAPTATIPLAANILSALEMEVTAVDAANRITTRANFRDNSNGAYSMQIWTTNAGTYSVVPQLCTSGCSSTSPVLLGMGTYSFDVLPAKTDANASLIFDYDVRYAGLQMTIDVQARDTFGNNQVYSSFKGADAFAYAATGPGPVTITSNDHHNGTYRAVWLATISGVYTVDASLHGQKIQGSPLILTIGPAPVSGPASLANGIGLGAGRLDADTPVSFSVALKDVYGNGGVLQPSLLHVALIGSARTDTLLNVPQTPVLDAQAQLTINITFPVLRHCNSLGLVHNGVSANLTAVGVIAVYFMNAAGVWSSAVLRDEISAATFKLTHLHGAQLTFSNNSVPTSDSGVRSFPVSIDSLAVGCVTSVSPQLTAAPYSNVSAPYGHHTWHTIRYHATVAGTYQLRIDHGEELVTGKQYTVVVEPGTFNESTSHTSLGQTASISSPGSNVSSTQTVAGRRTEFTVVVRDSFSNELAGGLNLLGGSMRASWPLRILVPSINNTGGVYHYSYLATSTGDYQVIVERMGVQLNSMTRRVVVVPAEPYGPNCVASVPGIFVFPIPVVGTVTSVSQLSQGNPQTFTLHVQLHDLYGNSIATRLNDTGFRCHASVHSTGSLPWGNNNGGGWMGSHLSAQQGNPVVVQASTPYAGTHNLSITIGVATGNSSALHIKGSPFKLLAQARECHGASSQLRVTSAGQVVCPTKTSALRIACPGLSHLIAGRVLDVGLTVVDLFGNPCTPSIFESVVHTSESLAVLATQALETPDQRAARLASEATTLGILEQQGEIAGGLTLDGRPARVLLMDKNRQQWTYSRFEMGAIGSYVFRAAPTITGEYSIHVTVNNETLLIAPVRLLPAPLDPTNSFIFGLNNMTVNTPETFRVSAMDQFDNFVNGSELTICVDVFHIGDPSSPSACTTKRLERPGNTSEQRCLWMDGCVYNASTDRCTSNVSQVDITSASLGSSVLPDNSLKRLQMGNLFSVSFSTNASGVIDLHVYLYSSKMDCSAATLDQMDAAAVASCPRPSTHLMSQVTGEGACRGSLVEDPGAEAIPRAEAKLWVMPAPASALTTSATGNGLRGAFLDPVTGVGSPATFNVDIRDMYGNLRTFEPPAGTSAPNFNPQQNLQVFIVNVNVTAASGHLLNYGCTALSCGPAVQQLSYLWFNQTDDLGNVILPTGFTTPTGIQRVGNTGEYIVTWTPTDPNTYHVVVFINQVRMPLAQCDFDCFPVGVYLSDQLKVPTLNSIADVAPVVAVNAGTMLTFNVQLRNSLAYDLNFGGYMESLIVGTAPKNITKCDGRPTICRPGWIADPFGFQISDNNDGSYTVSYTPQNPGQYKLHVMINLTHSSLPTIACTRGQLTCMTRYAPVCGHDENTYPNECFARNECVDVAYSGECVSGRRVPIPFFEHPIASFKVHVLPAGTSPVHSTISLLEQVRCTNYAAGGWCDNMKILQRTSAPPPRHVGLTEIRTFCDDSDSILAMHRCPGQMFQFYVHGKDIYGNVPRYQPRAEKFRSRVSGPVPVNINATDMQDNTYIYAMTLTISGDYVVNITMNHQEVGASSFWLRVDPPHYWSANTSTVAPDNNTVFNAGGSADLYMYPRGVYGNPLYAQPAPGPLADGSVILHFSPHTLHSKSVGSWDRSNRQVRVTYVVQSAGSYVVRVFFAAEPFSYSTFNIVVVAGRAVASQCIAWGTGLRDGTAGTLDRVVTIQARDTYSNNVTESSGIEHFSVNVQHTDSMVFILWGFSYAFKPAFAMRSYLGQLFNYNPPLYHFKYTAVAAGMYSNSLTLGGSNVPRHTSISRSSFQLNVANAPSFSKCQFTEAGSHIEIEFDKPTNKGREPQPSSCAKLLEQSVVATLGTDAHCLWVSSSRLRVTLAAGASILVGSSVSAKSNTILTAEENSRPVSRSTVLSMPTNMPDPVASILAPTSVGACDDLLLDASGSYGSGGRTMGYSWTVQAAIGSNQAQVYATLFAASCKYADLTVCSQAVVPASMLVAGHTYAFHVTVTNFWGRTGSAVAYVTKSANPTPHVVIEGLQVRSVRASELVRLRAAVELSNCYNGTKAMNFQWSVPAGAPTLNIPASTFDAAAKSRELWLQAGSMSAGTTYRLDFRGSMSAQPGIYADASTWITVVYSPLGVEIVGNSRRVSAGSNFQMDVMVHDPDDAALISTVNYKWWCDNINASTGTVIRTNSQFSPCGRGLGWANRVATAAHYLDIDAGMLQPGSYEFSVSATKDPGFRSSSARIRITVVQGMILDVAIRRQLPVGATETTYSTADRLILHVVVAGAPNAKCLWSSQSNLNLDLPGVLGTARTSSKLVVLPGQLTEPMYQFGVSCTVCDAACQRGVGAPRNGTASYSIEVNTPPASGMLILKDPATHSVVTQIQVADQLELSAENWVDQEAHRPLTYRFSFWAPSNMQKEIVLVESPSSTVTVRLPSGIQADSFAQTVAVRVSDRFGASALATATVLVFPIDASNAMSKVQILMNSTFADAVATKDVRELLQVCTIVGKLLKRLDGSRRRLQSATQEQQDIAARTINEIYSSSRSQPLDGALVSSFISSLQEVTASSSVLTSASIRVSMDALSFLLEATPTASIQPLDAASSTNVVQNLLIATLALHGQGAVNTTSTLASLEGLVTKTGRAQLPSVLCDEAGVLTQPLGNQQRFSHTSVKLCSPLTQLHVRHGNLASVTVANAGALLPVLPASHSYEAVLSTFYDNIYAPSQVPSNSPQGQGIHHSHRFGSVARCDPVSVPACGALSVPAAQWMVGDTASRSALDARYGCPGDATSCPACSAVTVRGSPACTFHPAKCTAAGCTAGTVLVPSSCSVASNCSQAHLQNNGTACSTYNGTEGGAGCLWSPPVMANLSSPVVSLHVYRSDTGAELLQDFPSSGSTADVLVPRAAWAQNDPWETTTLCGFFNASAGVWKACDVVSANISATVCRCPALAAVATLRSPSQCIQHTDCFSCLSDPTCGFCPGEPGRFGAPDVPPRCFEGNSAGEFFPGVCGEATWPESYPRWSYDSCPCDSFSNCGECMTVASAALAGQIGIHHAQGKTKRTCGYCPESDRCLPTGEAAKCPNTWYVNFVTGMQPADAYPPNCPQNCSVSWGSKYGYAVPGCTHGTCVDYVNCVCNPGYWSPDCSRMCPGGAGNPCSNHGQCSAGSTGTGTCFCNPGFGGSDCQDCDASHWGTGCVNRCDGGIDPAMPPGHALHGVWLACYGHGLCSSGQAGQGHCTCRNGFYGAKCESACPGAHPFDSTLSNICAGHGSCNDGRTGSGQCVCLPGFWGTGCGTECPRINGGPICSGSGTCDDGAAGLGQCTCMPTFYGTACEGECPGKVAAAPGLPQNLSCTNHGVCSEGSRGTGRCSCLNGWRGSSCALQPVRVRLAITLDVSMQQFTIFTIDAMLLTELGKLLSLPAPASTVLAIISVRPSRDVVVYLEILSVGYDPATAVLARLNQRDAPQLTTAISLPIVAYSSVTHIGPHWPCVNTTAGVCHGHGSCNETVGLCMCTAGWVGEDCGVSEASLVPTAVSAYEEPGATSYLLVFAALCVAVVVGGGSYWLYQKRAQLRSLFVAEKTDEASQQVRHWMALRRMAAGSTAADAFLRTAPSKAIVPAEPSTGKPGPRRATAGGVTMGTTTGAAARDVWHIAAAPRMRMGDSDDSSSDEDHGLASGWLRILPGAT